MAPGFKAAGLYPFTPNGPDYDVLTQLANEEVRPTSGISAKRTGRGSDGIGR